jgi:hypothetical protein
MFFLGVVLVALAVLFLLTAHAFSEAGRLPHPILMAAALATTLAAGVLLLAG